MDLFLTAHNILGHISKSRWVMIKDTNGKQVHKPLGYEWFSIETLQRVLPQHSLKELKFSVDLLHENHHTDKLSADDWLQIRVAAFEAGEQAYEQNYYINLHDQSKIQSSETWRKKNWFLIAVFAFVIGSIVAPISVEWAKHKLWPETTQPNTQSQPAADTSSQQR